jgi:hypothetical protein
MTQGMSPVSADCAYKFGVASVRHLPSCPSCGNGGWQMVTCGDIVDDPYPNRG